MLPVLPSKCTQIPFGVSQIPSVKVQCFCYLLHNKSWGGRWCFYIISLPLNGSFPTANKYTGGYPVLKSKNNSLDPYPPPLPYLWLLFTAIFMKEFILTVFMFFPSVVSWTHSSQSCILTSCHQKGSSQVYRDFHIPKFKVNSLVFTWPLSSIQCGLSLPRSCHCLHLAYGTPCRTSQALVVPAQPQLPYLLTGPPQPNASAPAVCSCFLVELILSYSFQHLCVLMKKPKFASQPKPVPESPRCTLMWVSICMCTEYETFPLRSLVVPTGLRVPNQTPDSAADLLLL